MKTVLTVLGARPQFIKAAVVSRALKKEKGLKEVILHTGQHYDDNMSEIFFREMEIPTPDIRLNLTQKTHGAMTGEMLSFIESEMIARKPDMVLVYGDTNSTMAGALAASKLHIPVAHIEAGMRSFDRSIPEEINRIVTDHVSDLLFCTTQEPADNLKKEGLGNRHILVTGDVMYDAFLYYQPSARAVADVSYSKDDFYLATIHRQENTDYPQNLEQVISAFKKLAKEKPVLLPLHPRTKKMLAASSTDTSGITLLPPLGYFEMLHLLHNCAMVLTDSGGLQREAYYAGKPCVVLRDVTEWKEIVAVGAAQLAGTGTESILMAADSLKGKADFKSGLYGDGHAAGKIADAIRQFFS